LEWLATRCIVEDRGGIEYVMFGGPPSGMIADRISSSTCPAAAVGAGAAVADAAVVVAAAAPAMRRSC
jgi:hypothetical protein